MSTPKKAHAVLYRGFHRAVPEARIAPGIASEVIEREAFSVTRYRQIGFLFSSMGNAKPAHGARARKAEAIYKRTGVWVQ